MLDAAVQPASAPASLLPLQLAQLGGGPPPVTEPASLQGSPQAAVATATETLAPLLRYVAELKTAEQRPYTSADALQSSFAAALENSRAVSFDIFDTALHRYVDHPQDVFLHLAAHPAFSGFNFSQPISRLRVEAEQTARAIVHRLIGSSEVNLLEIYQIFCDMAGISREQSSTFAEAEESVELRLCLPSPAIVPLWQAAKFAGKRVLFISDTYHHSTFLLKLLAHNGYQVEAADLFASSEHRKAKQDGQLFPVALAATGLRAAELLHVGDHPISDYGKPQQLGITSLLHPHKTSREQRRLLPLLVSDDQRLCPTATVRGVTSLARQRAAVRGHGQDFWWRFGYSTVGPLTVGFCQWLERSLRADGMEHACFLLRDGALLYAVYQALFAGQAGACPATTLPSSRRAVLLPVLELAPAFALPSLIGGIGARPLREYLERLQVSASGFEAEAAQAGFVSLDEPVDGRFEIARLLQFLLQKRVMSALLERGRLERNALQIFLERERVTKPGKLALVDLGWSGTIHKSLAILLGKMAPATELTGYYMATFPEAPHSQVPGLRVRSYLAHRGEPVETYDRILQFLNLFEAVYSSTAGSLLYFVQEADEVGTLRAKGIYQAPDKSAQQCRQMQAMHDAALAFAQDYQRCPAAIVDEPIPLEAAEEAIFRVITQPTTEEAHHLSGLLHCDNLGSASVHIAARDNASHLSPESLLHEYRRTHWKQGLLAAHTPQAMALRTLLWLLTASGLEHTLQGPEGA